MGGGSAQMTIKTDEPLEQAAAEYGLPAKDPNAIPTAPDITDGFLGDARKSQLLRTKAKQGLASTFLTGPDSTPLKGG